MKNRRLNWKADIHPLTISAKARTTDSGQGVPVSNKHRFAYGWRLLLLSCLLIAACFPLFSGQESASQAVAGLQKRYTAVNTVKADFQQVYRAPGVEQIESGVFWMKKPGLMRWEYRDPEPKLFIADGHNTYLYQPEDRQVMVSSFSASEMHSTPLQFLLGQGNIAANFDVSLETETKPKMQGSIMLHLRPRTPEPDYSHLVLELDAKTCDVKRIIIHEPTGNTSEFLLTNLETNVKVKDSQFRFQIPKGVEVIRLEEKN